MTAAVRGDVVLAFEVAGAAGAECPPRLASAIWPQTGQSREVTFARLLAPPFRSSSAEVRAC
ncbi:MAG TPA: hypothetical protein VIV12_01610, partial [Streptosporangiaceae bacterium]